MAKSSPRADLVWINSTSREAKLPRNGPVRQQIRRQAMSLTVADRQRRGPRKKINVGQLPSDIHHMSLYQAASSSPTITVDILPKRIEFRGVCDNEPQNWAPPTRQALQRDSISPSSWTSLQEVAWSMPASAYESMRIMYGFDPIDLSALTSFPVGQSAIKELHEQPSKLAKVLQCRQWSYFDYLPAIYGQSQCLDTALHCVAGRMHQYLRGDAGCAGPDVMHNYSLAVRRLQDVLNHPLKRLRAETLAACAVLAIHEILVPPVFETWKRHIAGASTLIKLRGPSRFGTPLEKALLLAFVGPIYTEAMLNAEACFLDEPQWQTTLASSIFEYTSYSECSEIYVSLWFNVVRIPRVLLHVQSAIRYPDRIPHCRLQKLQDEVKMLAIALKDWKGSYDNLVQVTAAQSEEERVHAKFDRRLEALGVYLASMIVINRAMAALDLARGLQLEHEAEIFAESIIALDAQTRTINPRAHLFMAFKVTVATAFRATVGQWTEAYKTAQGERSETTLVAWPLFKRWVELKGRRSDVSSILY